MLCDTWRISMRKICSGEMQMLYFKKLYIWDFVWEVRCSSTNAVVISKVQKTDFFFHSFFFILNNRNKNVLWWNNDSIKNILRWILAHAYYTHSMHSGHCGLTRAACQSFVTLNTTSEGSRIYCDSWCLNYQGLFCLLLSSLPFPSLAFQVVTSLCFLRWKDMRDIRCHTSEGEESKVKRACVHTGLFCLRTRALDVSAFISKTIGPFTITSVVFFRKQRTSRPRALRRLYSLLFDIVELFLELF